MTYNRAMRFCYKKIVIVNILIKKKLTFKMLDQRVGVQHFKLRYSFHLTKITKNNHSSINGVHLQKGKKLQLRYCELVA